MGLKAAVKHRLGADTTEGLTVAIQGLGKVGMGVAKQLHAEGAKLIVADVNRDVVRRAVEAFGAREASPDGIVTAECDVLSPNALGAILNDDTVPRLSAKIVAGGANNQLARDAHGAMLSERGILYAPDYVINGGGIIRVAAQIYDWSDDGNRAPRARHRRHAGRDLHARRCRERADQRHRRPHGARTDYCRADVGESCRIGVSDPNA